MSPLFGFIRNVVFSNISRLAFPYKITWALTYRCDCRCRMCKIWATPARRESSFEEIERISRNLRHVNWLDLTGGELTSRKDIVELVSVITRNSRDCVVVHIASNGQEPDILKSIVKKILVQRKRVVATVSIDGPEDVHDALRGKKGAYARAIDAYVKLKELPEGRYFVSCTLSQDNRADVPRLVRSLEQDIPSFRAADLHFNFFHRSGHYYQNLESEVVPLADTRDILRILRDTARGPWLKRYLEHSYAKHLESYLAGRRVPVRCQALAGSCFIDPYGGVYPCGIYSRKAGDLGAYGYDLAAVWNSALCRHIRKGIEGQACPGCWTPCEAYPALLGSFFRLPNGMGG